MWCHGSKVATFSCMAVEHHIGLVFLCSRALRWLERVSPFQPSACAPNSASMLQWSYVLSPYFVFWKYLYLHSADEYCIHRELYQEFPLLYLLSIFILEKRVLWARKDVQENFRKYREMCGTILCNDSWFRFCWKIHEVDVNLVLSGTLIDAETEAFHSRPHLLLLSWAALPNMDVL